MMNYWIHNTNSAIYPRVLQIANRTKADIAMYRLTRHVTVIQLLPIHIIWDIDEVIMNEMTQLG